MEIKWDKPKTRVVFGHLSVGEVFCYLNRDAVFMKIECVRKIHGNEADGNSVNQAGGYTHFVQETEAVERLEAVLEITTGQGDA